MSTSQQQTNTNSSSSNDESVKIALAVSLLRSKLFQNKNKNPNSQPSSESEALRWKRKAKERKQEILRLREDLREAEDASQCDLFPQSASCKCYFFENLGRLSPKIDADGSHRRFNDVLRRRFLRQVRLKERRRRRVDLAQPRRFSESNNEDELEQLRASVDFLVELCDTVSPVEEANFANWSHQAVDFILASVRNLSSAGKSNEHIEGTINGLIVRLVRRMCSPLKEDGPDPESKHIDDDSQSCIQHLIRKLANEAYIGQRVILLVSQRISVLAESLLFLDPFDDAFPSMHDCMFLMIQLIEFLISDYLLTWSKCEGFDNMLLEEWVKSVLEARKALELLESRNGLYVLYMDRVTGDLAKQVDQVSSLQKLNPEILDKLFL